MSKDKQIAELETQVNHLKLDLANFYRVHSSVKDELHKTKEALCSEKQKYAELLEKYITMMERMVRLNEQREAD